MHAPPIAKPSSAGLTARIDGARGHGAALATPLRTRMESAFGTPFRDVRVHNNGESHALNGHLGAQAFTVGSDIFLGASAAPNDARLIAHELTHVVQQRAMSDRGTLAIGRPADAYELQANKIGTDLSGVAPRAVESRALAASVSAPERGGGRRIQRFQAGETGHGGFEEEGLRKAGFTGDMGSGDIGAVYFGNWLRDWSQVTTSSPVTNALVYQIVNVLSWGEFNHELDPEQLGGYVPSEHLDNPLGGKTFEASDATPPEQMESRAKLSSRQRAELSDLDAHSRDIKDAVKASGLPPYIERGKAHIRARLTAAVQAGATREGMMELGDGLHAVEDYFAHSNFVELALSILASQGDAAVAAHASAILARAKSPAEGGFDATSADRIGKDPKGRGTAIVTGTYGDEPHSANQRVSLIEQIHSEILTGGLRTAFILGAPRALGDQVLGSIGEGAGWLAGEVYGGVTGFAKGLGKGTADAVSSVGSAIQQWATNPSNPPTGEIHTDVVGTAVRSMEADAKLKSANAAAAGKRVGSAAGGLAASLWNAQHPSALVLTKLSALVARLFDPLEGSMKKAVTTQTEASKKGAPREPGTPPGKVPPTHSELAKDAPDHPVYKAAGALAVNAIAEIGGSVRSAWTNPDKAAATRDVQKLVDLYVAYPTENEDTWKTTLTDFLKKGDKPSK